MKYSYTEYALLFKALSDETRLKIVHMVSDSPLCACSILEEFNITQPTLSYHMKILIASELVIGEKKGSWMFYTLNKEKALEMANLLSEIISQKIISPNNCVSKD